MTYRMANKFVHFQKELNVADVAITLPVCNVKVKYAEESPSLQERLMCKFQSRKWRNQRIPVMEK